MNRFILKENEIHVWSADLANFESINIYQASLSGDELKRAQGYKFAAASQNFIMSRGILRHLLAEYLGLAPSTIVFKYGKFGKPSVHLEQNRQALKFNLSHSANRVCYAFTQGSELGIDVQYHKENLPYLKLAKRFFTAAESEQLMRLPKEQQQGHFFALWAAKEAYVKANGMSLLKCIAQVSLESTPEGGFKLNSEQANGDWKIQVFNLKGNYTLALATTRPNPIINYYSYLPANP